MKIALIAYDAWQGRSTAYYPAMHMCALATPLSMHGYDVRVFDYSDYHDKIDEMFKQVQAFGPQLAGMTCYTYYVSHLHKMSKLLRTYIPQSIMVVGGSHPTIWPEWTLVNMPHIDYAMTGECDRSIVHLARLVEGKTHAASVPGLVYRSEGTIFVNKRDFIDSLDELPQIDRSFLDRYYKSGMYWDMAARSPLDMMLTSRGCPFDCNFCFKLERKYRFRSAGHVLEEFDMLKRRGVVSIQIQDDAFTANKQRCFDICNGLIRGKYRFRLKVRSRVNSIDAELLAKMKEAGVRQIVYGVESGSQKILDSMNKRTTVAMNRDAIALTKKAGIGCYAEIMIGMPGETRETINETIAFLKENRPIVGHIPVLYPLPGTKVYTDAQRDGTLQGDWKIDAPRPWVKLPWANSQRDIELEARRITRSIESDPRLIFYFLRLNMRTLGWKQVRFLFNHFAEVFIQHLLRRRR